MLTVNPDLAALVEGIRSDPDNNLRRLVAADWFEENGQEARAHYIRLAVHCAENPTCLRMKGDRECGRCENCKHYRELDAFEGLGERDKWAKELGIGGATWDRGFIVAGHFRFNIWFKTLVSEDDKTVLRRPLGPVVARSEPITRISLFEMDSNVQPRPDFADPSTYIIRETNPFFPALSAGVLVVTGTGTDFVQYADVSAAYMDHDRAAVRWALAQPVA